jgi:hypothetical protein
MIYVSSMFEMNCKKPETTQIINTKNGEIFSSL